MNKNYQKCLAESKTSVKRKLGGFTLIELLVVVLIIGILAGVALPQYERAVKKTKFQMVHLLMRNIMQEEKIYYMANGAWVPYEQIFDELEVFKNWTAEGSYMVSPDKKVACLGPDHSRGRRIRCGVWNSSSRRKELPDLEQYFYGLSSGVGHCWFNNNNMAEKQFCLDVGFLEKNCSSNACTQNKYFND